MADSAQHGGFVSHSPSFSGLAEGPLAAVRGPAPAPELVPAGPPRPGAPGGGLAATAATAETTVGPFEIAGRSARLARGFLLFVVDLVALEICFFTAVKLWAEPYLHQPLAQYLPLLPLSLLFPLSFWMNGLYPGFGIGPIETVRRLALRITFVFVALATSSFVFKMPAFYSRVTFGIAWLLAVVLLPLARLVVGPLMQRLAWWSEPALVIGTEAALARFDEIVEDGSMIGYRPAGTAVVGPAAVNRTSLTRPRGAMHVARQFAQAGGRVVLVAEDGSNIAARLIGRLQEHFRHVVLIRVADRLPVEGVVVRDLGGLLGIEFQNQSIRPFNRVVKRSTDLLLTCAAAFVAAPVIGLAALAVKLVDRGPAFYAQEREGKGGRYFRVWKLRTMYVDSAERLEQHLATDPAARAEWESTFKLKNDPRILPRVGVLLRRLSIDELPQLWSVLIGEMSLVGPRPFPRYHLERFDEEFLRLRRQVRPGLTGLWQVTVRGGSSLEQQKRFDSYYIRNWSLWMDFYVIARTAFVVLGGKGAY